MTERSDDKQCLGDKKDFRAGYGNSHLGSDYSVVGSYLDRTLVVAVAPVGEVHGVSHRMLQATPTASL